MASDFAQMSAMVAGCRRGVYTELNPTRHEVRLIRLKHAMQGPIEGDTIVQSLARFDVGAPDHEGVIPFEAVSYVWNDPALTEQIMVNGHQLPITRSAFDMLTRLRKAKHQYLWIDAICIDQENDTERSHQVQHMRRIYASARRVIFYLGQPTVDTNLLMAGLWALQKGVRPARNHAWLPGHGEAMAHEVWTTKQVKLCRDHLNARQRQREGLQLLLLRSWFRRIWIIQEVSNARDGLVHCGDWAVSCRVFRLAPKLLRIGVSERCQHILDAMPTPKRETSWLGKEDDRTLFKLLQKFRKSEASEERDKIYALLGLYDSPPENTLVVDYTQSEAEVVRHAIAHICMCSASCLGENIASTITLFLDSLSTLHQKVLSHLVQTNREETVPSIISLFQEMDNRQLPMTISPTMLLDSVHNQYYGAVITELLLERGPNFPLTEEILAAVINNPSQGQATMKRLVDSRGSEIILTDDLATYIMRNGARGAAIAELLHQNEHTTVTESRYMLAEFAQARSVWSSMYTFFEERDARLVAFPPDLTAMVKPLSGGEASLHSFLGPSGSIFIADALVLAAILYRKHDAKILAILLEYTIGTGYRCSDRVLALAMRDPSKCHEYLDIMVQYFDAKEMAQIVESSNSTVLWEFLQDPIARSLQSPFAEGKLPLWWAVTHKACALMEALVQKGASLNVEHRVRGTPLSYATRKKDIGMVQTLLAASHDTVEQIRHWGVHIEPLATAAENGSTEVLRLILDQSGASIDTELRCGCTPLFHAAAHGRVEAVKFMVQRGASTDLETWYRAKLLDESKVMYKCWHVHDFTKDHCATLRLLLEPPGNPGGTARLLHFIAQNSEYVSDDIYILARLGVSMDLTDAEGYTPLHHASRLGWRGIVEELLSLHAKVDALDRAGNTALHHAVLNNEENIVDILLEEGARVTLKNGSGKTPRDLAESVGNKRIYDNLRDHEVS
ncbi:HET domain-containing protein [Microdochium nivale]|nr:HET domain-containing protein [Microdochium nivale]